MPSPFPMIVAHRGLHTHCRENSLESFIAADEAGLEWVECDVWASSDHLPVIIHDPNIESGTSGAGEVRHHKLVELKAMGLPSLSDLVEALNKRSAPGLVVEIKPRIHRPLLKAVLNILADYEGTCLLQSFHEDNIIDAWNHDSGVHTAMLVKDQQELTNAVDRGWRFINAQFSLVDEGLVKKVHGLGRRIGVWTVNLPSDIEHCVAIRVDMLTTDEPLTATRIAANAGKL